jgi:hypothetical protein
VSEDRPWLTPWGLVQAAAVLGWVLLRSSWDRFGQYLYGHGKLPL